MSEFFIQLAKNQVFGGLGAAAILSYVLYAARSLPHAIWELLKWRLTCSLTIFSEDSAYERANEWLAGLDYTKQCRRLRLTMRWNSEEQQDVEVLAPGIGRHLFWYKGHPIVVRRALPDKGGIGGWKRFEDIEIVTIGSNPRVLQGLVDEIKDARKNTYKTTTSVHLYRNRWRIAIRKTKRPPESVILPAELKDVLFRDIEWFQGARQWYQERGVPYRRGYMLEGAPGCGKTSLVLAVASHFDRPIYALNLGSIANDDELIDAVCEVPEHGILLIEDIDAAQAGAKRTSKPSENATPSPKPKSDNQSSQVSLSALLNVLDGAFAREGRVVFMTTNHPEKIDPALLRTGRADRRITIGKLEEVEALQMIKRFKTEASSREFLRTIDLPITAADLQEKLVASTVCKVRMDLKGVEDVH